MAFWSDLLPELTRGLTTALSVQAAQVRCPDCLCQPTLHCPNLPGCVCAESLTQCPVTVGSGCPSWWEGAFVGFVIGAGIGAFAWYWVARGVSSGALTEGRRSQCTNPAEVAILRHRKQLA